MENLGSSTLAQPLQADVCVVGSGPVGQAVVSTLVRAGRSVILLESGDLLPSDRLRRSLGDASVEGDDRFGTIWSRVNRAVGGSSWRWVVDLPGFGQGVRYALIEPGLFQRRVPGQGAWPFESGELHRHYEAALRLCRVDATVSELLPRQSSMVPEMDDASYVFGPRDAFHHPRFDGPGSCRLITNATVVAVDGSGSTVTDVRVRNLAGGSASVRAAVVVLAAGTIETTRILLNARSSISGLASNQRIGLNLMDRPRTTGTLRLNADPPEYFAEFANRRVDGTFRMRRLVTPMDQVRDGVPSQSFLLQPAYPDRRGEHLAKQVLAGLVMNAGWRAYDVLPAPLGSAVAAVKKASYRARAGMIHSLLSGGYDTEWSGWTRDDRWRTHRTWRVVCLSEGLPNVANRIELGSTPDALGITQPVLRFGAPATVVGPVLASMKRATEAIESAGLGTLKWDEDEYSNVSSAHMMGTVPIGNDPSTSAADANGLVRGTSNLYVAGNCVFPQGGHANPTIGSMAIGMRTAEAIASQL